MDEGTTTDAAVSTGATIQGIPVDDQGRAIPDTVAQPEEPAPAEAVQETTEQPEEQAEAPADEPSEKDDELDSWAKNKGLELDSDNAIKAAKIARDAERFAHSKSQKASELEKTMTEMSDASAEQVAQATGENPEVLKRVQRMEVRDSIREFWDSNPDARQYQEKMAQIAVDSGLYGTPEAILKASYAIARSQDIDAVKSQAKRETLESLAHKQQAAVPTGNAVTNGTSSSQITPQNVDQMVANMSSEEYRRRLPEINAAIGAV